VTTPIAQSGFEYAHAPFSTSPLAKNPDSGGTPEIASHPTRNVANVQAMNARSPPILDSSCSPSRPWMTEPAPRNKSPLKKAWATIRKIAATYAPEPTASTM